MIKKRFSYHVDPLISDAQIQKILESYIPEDGEAPNGWYQKTGDILQIEMITPSSMINRICPKLKGIIEKVTARGVIPATELGDKGPVPETTSPPILSYWTGNTGESFAQTISNLFFKGQTLLLVVAVIVIGLVILRVGK